MQGLTNLFVRVLLLMLIASIFLELRAESTTHKYRVSSPLKTQAPLPTRLKKISTKLIAYMPPATEFNYYLDIGKGIQSVASNTGSKVILLAPQSDIPGQQMLMLEEVIRRNVDGIILSTHQPLTAAPLIKKAIALGIKVIIVNSDALEFSTPVHGIVGYNQQNGTYKLGKYLLENVTNSNSKVGIIEGAPGGHNDARVLGFINAIKDSNLDVVARHNGKWNTEGGNAAALKIMGEHPDISVLFATNDFEIIGAKAALETLDKDGVILLGNDGDPAALMRIAANELTATVHTFPMEMGQTAMHVILDAINGSFNGGYVETPTIIVDKSNIDQYWRSTVPTTNSDFSEMRVVSEELPDFVNADGSGLYMDILKAVFEEEGIKFKLTLAPYARGELIVKSNKADVLLGAYRGTVDGVIFPQWYYSANYISVLYQRKNLLKWQGQQSLTNKNVMWIRHYNYEQFLYVPVQKMTSTSRTSMLGMLEKGRVDFILDDGFSIRKKLAAPSISVNTFNKAEFEIQDLMRLKLYLAFANSKKGENLAKIFDDKFPQLLAAGELKRLFEKWNVSPFPYQSYITTVAE